MFESTTQSPISVVNFKIGFYSIRGQELLKARRVEKNLAATIESLALCLPVLQTFSKLSRQMKEKRYHPALKTLEQLEHNYLPRIANYR